MEVAVLRTSIAQSIYRIGSVNARASVTYAGKICDYDKGMVVSPPRPNFWLPHGMNYRLALWVNYWVALWVKYWVEQASAPAILFSHHPNPGIIFYFRPPTHWIISNVFCFFKQISLIPDNPVKILIHPDFLFSEVISLQLIC